ncbi:MAG: glutamine amidotransferase [Bryobacteraceae bacterium]
MFEFLFNYPLAVYRKGTLVFSGGWSAPWLAAAVVLAAVGLFWLLRRRGLRRKRLVLLGVLQWSVLAVLLLLLWQPALSVTVLKPQQNVVAVVVDASASMQLEQRYDQARTLVEGRLVEELKKRYPVRLYVAGEVPARVEELPEAPQARRTDLGAALRQIAADSSMLPVGAVVLFSDGADNGGNLGPETLEALRRARIPVHTVGFGSEKIQNDLEILDAALPGRVLPGSRMLLTVTLRQSGFRGRTAQLAVRDGDSVLAQKDLKLPEDGGTWRETVALNAGRPGVRTLTVSAGPLEGETNIRNNTVERIVDVRDRKPRILYFEGEPRWEMKFIRRAVEEDGQLDLASIVRTTENRFYRQGIRSPQELERGFPSSVDELFGYQALILGNVEAGYFSPSQQTLIREFVDRRGGGVLFLGGRAALSDGGWHRSPLAEVLPVVLPERKGTFRREPASAELTRAGMESLITRIEEDPEKNAARWKALPYLADYQQTGAPKPGATVLAEAVPGVRLRHPLLVTQNFGRGRVALLATGGTWRWQMAQDARDQSHETFWRQLLRWLAGSVEERVALMTSRQTYEGGEAVRIRAEVRDRTYLPSTSAVVSVHVMGPGGVSDTVELSPSRREPGVYEADWRAPRPGSYLAEAAAREGLEDLGRDPVTVRREDGMQEFFRTEQNRELLERLAQQTGGRYYRPAKAAGLAKEIELSEAGITVRETRPVWNAPAAFLLLAGLKTAEWLVRRRWGAV